MSLFNVLITSISKKVPLLKAVKGALANLALKNKMIGADSNPQAIGRYFVDEFWEMPPLEKLPVEELIQYCVTQNIQAIIPTRDGELPFFAVHRERLKANGISCMVSVPDAVENCRDKLKFFQFLNTHGFAAIPTSKNLSDLAASAYVVKEQFGAGSRSIGLNLDEESAKKWASSLKDPLFQPYIRGEEYSLDLYVDKLGSTHGTITRHRDYVMDGESQITSSFKHPPLEEQGSAVVESLGLYGHAVLQVIKDMQGTMHLVECNPRFGGASTLSVAMGLASFEWFFLEVLNRPVPPFVRSAQEKRQVRFAEDLILNLPD